MGRTKGAVNKRQDYVSRYSKMTVDERLSFLANVIVDRIIEDQQNNSKLLKKVKRHDSIQPKSA